MFEFVVPLVLFVIALYIVRRVVMFALRGNDMLVIKGNIQDREDGD